jgi:hypothetical protein
LRRPDFGLDVVKAVRTAWTKREENLGLLNKCHVPVRNRDDAKLPSILHDLVEYTAGPDE